MKLSQKIISGIAAISLAATVAACQKKEEKKAPAKVVKTERVVVDRPAAAKATVDSLDARVTDIERRMAVARKQYAKDRRELDAERAAIRARLGQ